MRPLVIPRCHKCDWSARPVMRPDGMIGYKCRNPQCENRHIEPAEPMGAPTAAEVIEALLPLAKMARVFHELLGVGIHRPDCAGCAKDAALALAARWQEQQQGRPAGVFPVVEVPPFMIEVPDDAEPATPTAEPANPCPVSYPHLPHDYCDGKPNAYRLGTSPNSRCQPTEQATTAEPTAAERDEPEFPYVTELKEQLAAESAARQAAERQFAQELAAKLSAEADAKEHRKARHFLASELAALNDGQPVKGILAAAVEARLKTAKQRAEAAEQERDALRADNERLQALLDGECALCGTPCYKMLTDDHCAQCDIDSLTADNARLSKQNAALRAELAKAAETEREAILAILKRSWTFDNYQQHTHSWHTMQDTLEMIRARG